jgi:ABC-type transport system substrate-binding protein
MRIYRAGAVRRLLLLTTMLISVALLVACGTETVVETVIVEKVVTEKGDTVIQTVVGETIIQKVVETVIVEKMIAGEIVKVVETVIVEKVVTEKGDTVIQTVVVQTEIERILVATPTPGATPTPPTISRGTLRVAVSAVDPPAFLPRNVKFPSNQNFMSWGLFDGLIGHSFAASPRIGEPGGGVGLAESWIVASDLKSVTLKLREGIQFHKGWGEMTAEDLAYTYNDTLLPDAISKAGEMRVWMKDWEVIDRYTVKFNAQPGEVVSPGWTNLLAQPHGANSMVFSRAVFDKLGPDGANATPVSTGPFQVEKWLANEEIIMRAVTPHWRQTPHVEILEIIEMQELSTRLAAFRTGEVHIAPLPLDNIKDALDRTGGYAVEPQKGSWRNFYFGGNYWLKNSQPSGEPEEYPRAGFDPSLPWIGDPYENGDDFDADTPSMERARKVRMAMTLAVDRETLNKAFASGFGQVVGSVSYFGVPAGSEFYNKANESIWEFDVTEAKRLLAEAGYSDGFEITAFIAGDKAAIVPANMSQAVVQMWRDNLGLEVKIDSTSYAGMRPNLIGRNHNQLYVWRQVPPDQDATTCHGMCGGKGWTPGVEIPGVADNWKLSDGANTLEDILRYKAEQDNALLGEVLIVPMLLTPGLTAVRPEVEWNPPTAAAAEGGNFEFAKLVEN